MATIKQLQARNRRVELDKAWETSGTRRGIIAAMTYLVIVVFLLLIEAPRPWLSAAVPAIGYVLSTLTLPIVKRWWIRNK